MALCELAGTCPYPGYWTEEQARVSANSGFALGEACYKIMMNPPMVWARMVHHIVPVFFARKPR
jgi:hypothetical protein